MSDSFTAGWDFAEDGAVRILDVGVGLPPADATLQNGVAVTAAGQVCMSFTQVADVYVHGWPVTVAGVVCAELVP